MQKHTSRALSGSVSELGTITNRMELKLDNFKHPIPDFLVSEHLTLDPDYLNDSYGEETPPELKPLSPGDRVAVAVVNGGQDHVVVARVVNYG
ncbi:hypothetical protein DXT76_13745 [Halobacillus trueperi]|uniref:Uncharacterized protein n=2 Tax=Halobacillus trueperi TaxID=156205 RepID=A0A3D8VLS7_9BACI|nr:hypothetical protein DXT76_13745 [Halobacillus trueperi]